MLFGSLGGIILACRLASESLCRRGHLMPPLAKGCRTIALVRVVSRSAAHRRTSNRRGRTGPDRWRSIEPHVWRGFAVVGPVLILAQNNDVRDYDRDACHPQC
jgi:hypothetical protein